jgi:hypothetical protein
MDAFKDIWAGTGRGRGLGWVGWVSLGTGQGGLQGWKHAKLEFFGLNPDFSHKLI